MSNHLLSTGLNPKDMRQPHPTNHQNHCRGSRFDRALKYRMSQDNRQRSRCRFDQRIHHHQHPTRAEHFREIGQGNRPNHRRQRLVSPVEFPMKGQTIQGNHLQRFHRENRRIRQRRRQHVDSHRQQRHRLHLTNRHRLNQRIRIDLRLKFPKLPDIHHLGIQSTSLQSRRHPHQDVDFLPLVKHQHRPLQSSLNLDRTIRHCLNQDIRCDRA